MKAIWICHRVQTKLWEYASGRLSASDSERTTLHLQRCAACRAEMDRVRMVVPALVAQQVQPIPASQTDFVDVLQRIERQQSGCSQIGRPQRYVVAVSIVAVAGLTISLYCGISAPQILRPAATDIPLIRPMQPGANVVVKTPVNLNPLALNRSEPSNRRSYARVVERQIQIAPHRFRSPLHVALAEPESRSIASAARFRLRRRSAPTLVQNADSAVMPQRQAPVPPDDTNNEYGATGQHERNFVMPLVGQDDSIQRTFVIQNIPTADLAAQSGTAAAAAENTGAGKAL